MSGRCWRILISLLLGMLILAADGGVRPAPTFAAVTLKPGDFLLADGFSRRLLGVDAATGAVSPLSSNARIHYPYYVAGGPDGEVFFMDYGYFIDFNTQRAVVARLDLTTGIPSVVTMLSVASPGLIGASSGLAFDSNRALIVLDVSRIIRVDRATGQQTTISSGGLLSTTNTNGYNAEGIAIERDDSILTSAKVAGDPRGHRQVVRIRASTHAQEVAAAGGLLRYPYRIAVGPDGSIFVVDLNDEPSLDYPTHYVLVQIQPQTGAQRIVADLADVGNVGGIVVDSSGTVFLSVVNSRTSFSGIVRIDPLTGQLGVVTNSAGIYPMTPGIAMVQVASSLPCPRAQRSPITVRTSALGGGRLQVSVRAGGTPNAIRAVRLGTFPGSAELESQPSISGPDATFVLRRTGPGAVTLPFTVVDACGEWQTFVGAGPNGF
jgi:sugar lactone lactonase YvrE